jgi:hypothetical protein
VFGLPSGLDCSAARFENESKTSDEFGRDAFVIFGAYNYAKVVVW